MEKEQAGGPGRSAAFLPGLAAALFIPLLAFQGFGPLDFWWGMAASLFLLLSLGLLSDHRYRSVILQDARREVGKKLTLGLASAVVLLLFFWAGGAVSRTLLPFASEGIERVYAFKSGVSAVRILLLMVLVIGPGEEIFWRGFIQRRWQSGLGFPAGWLLASIFYAFVHIGSHNVMLVLAALVCGLFWGALYWRYRSILLVAVSHTAWDLLVFFVFPLR